MTQPSLLHRALTRRNPWIAFLLTQLCPGWGQIYNRDWKWLGITFVLVVLLTTYTTIFLFDSLSQVLIAIGLGLLLDLGLSIQAYKKAKQIQTIERPAHHFTWWHLAYRLFGVYFLFAAVLFGFPDGYGFFMPTRLRSFQIPSESMVPNLLVGDRLVADGWAYWGKEPKRGDVVVFDYPKDPSVKYVKRLVGLPGDVIEFKQGELFLNGKIAPQRRTELFPQEAKQRDATEFLETLDENEHVIFRIHPSFRQDFGPVTVPAGNYFMLGDNRDRSSDSRFWGFVSRDQLIGRMSFIYFSWDSDTNSLRKDRLGLTIH
jgi:signal peptidase I